MSGAGWNQMVRMIAFAARLQDDMKAKAETRRRRSCPWCGDRRGLSVRRAPDGSVFQIQCRTSDCMAYVERDRESGT
ncbi:MAG: hypothetical protein WBF53_05120 [Litorimonas sp.]